MKGPMMEDSCRSKKKATEIDWKYYEELARESRVAQGLPEKIVCPVALKHVAELFKPSMQ